VQPEAFGPPASHPHPDARALGRQRPYRVSRLRPRLCPRHSRCPLRDDRAGGALRPYRAARRIRPPRRGLRGLREIIMRVYHFTEQPYPDAWDKDPVSIRATLPNKYLDPVRAADLYHEYLDAW